MTAEREGVCRNCGERIWLYVHSQAGPLKATAWTNIDPDEDEPRWGTTCPDTGGRHVPERFDALDDVADDMTQWERDVAECFDNGGGWDR